MLDCETPIGRVAIAHEHQIAHKIAYMSGLDVGFTSPACHVDALFYDGGKGLVRVAEVKSRNITMAYLMGKGSYMISAAKIAAAREIALGLLAPFSILVGLYTDGKLCDIVSWRVANKRGEQISDYHTERMRTQATCNGGEKDDDCAFFPVAYMEHQWSEAKTDTEKLS